MHIFEPGPVLLRIRCNKITLSYLF